MKNLLVIIILFCTLHGTIYVQRLFQIDRVNLVRLYYFNESSGSTVGDHSDNFGYGDVTSAVLADSSQPNGMNSIVFDGINDIIDLNPNDSLSDDWTGTRDKGTILFWARSESWTNGATRLFMMKRDEDYFIRIGQTSADNRFQARGRFGTGNDRIINENDADTVLGNNWFSLVVVFDTTLGTNDYFSFYLNGDLNATLTTLDLEPIGAGTFTNISNGITVGSGVNNDGLYWYGDIGLGAIWKSALTEEEIQRISKI